MAASTRSLSPEGRMLGLTVLRADSGRGRVGSLLALILWVGRSRWDRSLAWVLGEDSGLVRRPTHRGEAAMNGARS